MSFIRCRVERKAAMKFDKDVVREILLAIEASGQDPRAWIEIQIPGKSQEEVSYQGSLQKTDNKAR
jgi:hypothetical protein